MDTISRKAPIPNHIRELRERSRMTLSELAEKSGITVQMLSRLERGERALTDHSLAAIAGALGVKKAFLLEDIESPGRPPLKGDLVEDDYEATVLRFWRSLSAQARLYIFREMTNWADTHIDGPDVRAPATDRIPAAVND